MTANKIGSDLYLAETEVADPGNAGTISVNKSLAICNLVSAGAETRTLPLPYREGVVITIFARTVGGTITLTVTGGLDLNGTTTFAFTAVDQFLVLQSFRKADGTLIWLKISDYGIGEVAPDDAAVLAAFSGLTATVSEINQAADESTNSEIVITTNVITADESGKTFYLTLAGGFTSTLPAPALGLRFRFIVAVAPTTSYIITTNSSANILYGMTEERAGTAGVAGAAKNTFNFVANQSIIADWVEFWSDGTNWYYHGMTNIAAGNTVS